MDVVPNFDLSSDHSPVIATISTTVINIKKAPKLHNSKTDWELFRNVISENIKLNVTLTDRIGLEEAMNNLITTVLQATHQATPHLEAQNRNINIPLEIKKLIAKKKEKPEQNGIEATHQ